MESRSSSAGKADQKKIIVILGPTSSGKSDVAIKLARKFDGEVISADSRQVYRWMDIGSGKVTPKEQKMAPHHFLDVAHPNDAFNVSHFKKEADQKIGEILRRGKIPILCGGTGFWIKSVIDNVSYPEVAPDPILRVKLAPKSADELFEELKKLDLERARNIDPKNKVRIIRAIEICKTLGKVPPSSPLQGEGWGEVEKYDFLQIGIYWLKEELEERIRIRLEKRFSEGMIDEVRDLHKKHGVSWERLFELGLEYRYISLFLQGKLAEEEMKEKLLQEIRNYAKRQRTWFQKDKRIIWLEKYEDIEKAVRNFLS